MREYQCLLHRAISDKLELEQHMVTCGMEAGGGAGEGQGGEDKHIKGWGADPSDNDRQCNFSRRLPWPLRLAFGYADRPAARRPLPAERASGAAR